MAAITDLATASSAGDSDYLVLNQGGTDRKMTRTMLGLTGTGRVATGGYVLTVGGTSAITGSCVGNITGGGTIATGGFTLTVPATGTAALLGGSAFTGVVSVAAASPYLQLISSHWSGGSAYIQAGVSTTAGATGDYLTILVPTGKGLSFAANAVSKMAIGTDGTVLIANLAGSGNRALYADPNGILTVSASDGRMKTDVTPIDDGEALAIVELLRPVRYRWHEGLRVRLGNQIELGLIAQEVLPIVPEVIGSNTDGMMSLDYAKLVPLLVGALQALAERVKALEAG